MKKIFIFLLMILSIIAITFQGCIEQTNKIEDEHDEKVTSALNILGFVSNELPNEYITLSEVFNDTEISSNLSSGEAVIILERYNAFYGFNATLPSLTILMTKYDSAESAVTVFSEYNVTFFDNGSSGEIYKRTPAEQIGDESALGILTSGEYLGTHQIIFRKLNVVARLYTHTNITQDESIYYAKILINHIESSLS